MSIKDDITLEEFDNWDFVAEIKIVDINKIVYIPFDVTPSNGIDDDDFVTIEDEYFINIADGMDKCWDISESDIIQIEDFLYASEFIEREYIPNKKHKTNYRFEDMNIPRIFDKILQEVEESENNKKKEKHNKSIPKERKKIFNPQETNEFSCEILKDIKRCCNGQR
jgi:hypothetical protein